MVGEMSVPGNVLVGKCPVGEVSGRGIVRSGKCPSGKCQSGICPRGSVSRGSVRSGNCPTIGLKTLWGRLLDVPKFHFNFSKLNAILGAAFRTMSSINDGAFL